MRTAPLLALALLVPACSDSGQVTPDGPLQFLDRAPPSAEKVPADLGRSPDRKLVDSAPAASVCGKLVDSAGAPIAGGGVIICIG